MIPVTYCRGRSAHDAQPTLHQAPDFDQFVAQILDLPRATTRNTRSYICGPMRPNGDGRAHRGKADLLPRSWIALDLDGGSREDCDVMLLRLADYQAITWTTARHVQECPRVRIVMALDREVNGPEGERLGAALVGVVGAGLPSLKWDRSTHKGEQECFLPMAGAKVMRYGGDPIDVDAVLALAPAEPSRERLATPDPYRALIIERGLFLRELGPGKDAIRCPFASEHSEDTADTATVYLHPLHGGYKWGKIHCLHAHCADRKQEEHMRALGAEPREVWRGQAGGSAPYDDLPPVGAYGDEAAQEDARRHTESTKAPTIGEGRDPVRPNEPPSYHEIPPLAELRIAPADLHIARLTPQCVVESYLFADVAVLAAPGGTGKTTLFLFEAVHIVLARPLYGLEVRTPGAAVVITAEDRRELLIARLGRIMEALELDAEERAQVCAGVMIWDVTGAVCRLTELDRQGNVVLTALADAIVERFREASPVVVGLDPVISFGVGERLVNDHEHSLILAARRIVRGLRCCVRLIAHTGKENARSGTLDQYASRGGSALSDGARMVAVLRSWDSEAADDNLTPPPGLSVGVGEQVIVLARPKLSYAPPQPIIWLTRCGYAFRHFIATRPDPEAEAKACADQIERYLIEKIKAGQRFTQNMLQDVGVMKRKDLRVALATLRATRRVIDADLPEEERQGGRQKYLHHAASSTAPKSPPDLGAVVSGEGATTAPRDGDSTTAPPYREEEFGAVVSADTSSLFPDCAGEQLAQFGAVGAVGANNSTCHHCSGSGCDECAGYGCLIDDEPEEVQP